MNLPLSRIWLVFLCLFLTTISYSQTASDTKGCFPLEVDFEAPARLSEYYWDFDDGATATMPTVTNTFGTPGIYNVVLSEGQNGPVVGTLTIEVFSKPVATIAADPLGGCVPLVVNFQNEITNFPINNITDYQWSFGDGQTGSGSTPTNTYNQGGVFDIGLEILTDLTGCNNTLLFQDIVSASASPEISFTTSPDPPSACDGPLEVTFTNTTTETGLDYQWNFGNGQTSTDFDPGTITYTNEGAYMVTFTATNQTGCATTLSQNVTVGNPVPVFFIPDTICFGEEYEYTITNVEQSTPGTFTWDFGDGGVQLGVDTLMPLHPIIIYETPGWKTISLTVVTEDGCTGTTTKDVFVQDLPNSFMTVPDVICFEPLVVNITPEYDDPNATYQWLVSRDSNSFERILNNGNYIYGFNERTPQYVFYNEDTTTYSMNGAIVLYTHYRLTSRQGCMVENVLSDTLFEPNALFMPDVVDGCAPLTVTFADSSNAHSAIVNYTYDYGDGNVASFGNDDPHSHTFNNAGTYGVTLSIITESGCRDTSYAVKIEVGEEINNLDFTADQTTVCPLDTVLFTGISNNPNIDAWHFYAENGNGFHCFQENEMRHNFDGVTGPQDITLEVEYNGCFSSITKNDFITVNGPIAKIDYEIDCENPFDVIFRDSSLDATGLTWRFGDGATSSTENPVHPYQNTGDYVVYLEAENSGTGCPVSVDSMLVSVRDVQAAMEPIDSLYCIGAEVDLNSSPSQDVDNRCWKGFTWQFSWQRPITTRDTLIKERIMGSGNHQIDLIVTDINACKDTFSQNVSIFNSQPNFTVSENEFCLPSDIVFTNTSESDTTIAKWEWNFGDDMTGEGEITTHQYQPPLFPEGASYYDTTLYITLFIEDVVGCRESISRPVRVYEPRADILYPDSANVCVGGQLIVSASDFEYPEGTDRPLNYFWDFGNGVTGDQQTDTIVFDEIGTYIGRLNIEEEATGCPNLRPLDTIWVSVQSTPESAFTSSVDGQDPICYPELIEFFNSSSSDVPVEYLWDFGDGSSSTEPNPSITFDKGTYTVQLISETSAGCRDTVSRDFTLVGPEGELLIAPDVLCLGELVNFSLINQADLESYRWEFGDGITVENQQNVTHEYQSPGVFNAELILTGINEVCETAISQLITVEDVQADFLIPAACVGEVQIIDNSTGMVSNYFYDFGNGTTSNDPDPIQTFNTPGNQTIQLVIESAIGCMDSITQTLNIFPLPEPEVPDAVGCEGVDLVLNAINPSGNSNYFWTPEDLINNNGGSSVTVNLTETTTFSILETDENNCENETTATIDIVPAIPPVPDEERIVCNGEVFQLQVPSNPLYTYLWTSSTGETTGLSCTDCADPVVTIDGSVTYTVLITDVSGTCSEQTAEFVFLVPVDNLIGVPNAFTPNGDNQNDFFNYVIDNETAPITVSRFQVFDRFGNMVYNNETPTTGWDGRLDGKLTNSDVYLYNIEISVNQCLDLSLKGDVTLIR